MDVKSRELGRSPAAAEHPLRGLGVGTKSTKFV